jgi:hypothetical protein
MTPESSPVPQANGRERIGVQLGSKRLEVSTNHLLSLVLVAMIGAAGYWLSRYLDTIQARQHEHITRQETRLEAISKTVEHRFQALHAAVEQRAQSFLDRQANNVQEFHRHTQEERQLMRDLAQKILDGLRWHDRNATVPVEQRVPLYDEPPEHLPGRRER